MQENKLLTNSTDPHLFFTFNNIYSKNWNLFIENTNKGGGTKIVASPDKTVSFATPDYQNNTYYLGTTKKQKTFKHTLAANMLDKNDVQAILQWLKVGQTGFLYYDTNKYWGWDVVISDVGEVSQYEDSTGIIIEFSVEFKTINDWHARSVYSAWKKLGSDGFETIDSINSNNIVISQSIANEYGIPEICQSGTTLYLPQVCDEHSFIQLNWKAVKDNVTQIENNGNTILSYSFNDNALGCFYDSRYGFTLMNGDLLENSEVLKENTDTVSSIFNLDNVLPTTDSSKYISFNYYECRVYDKTSNPQNNTYNNIGFPSAGTAAEFPLKYTVGIRFYECSTLDSSGNPEYTEVARFGQNFEETGNPIATYYGLYNTLTIIGYTIDPIRIDNGENEQPIYDSQQNSLTIIKHSSL